MPLLLLQASRLSILTIIPDCFPWHAESPVRRMEERVAD